MKLTGKTKEAFITFCIDNNYCKNPHIEYWLNNQIDEIYLNALIIDFLDTIKYMGVPLFEYCFSAYWHHRIESQSFNNVCIKSIEKANEIFNLNNK